MEPNRIIFHRQPILATIRPFQSSKYGLSTKMVNIINDNTETGRVHNQFLEYEIMRCGLPIATIQIRATRYSMSILIKSLSKLNLRSFLGNIIAEREVVFYKYSRDKKTGKRKLVPRGRPRFKNWATKARRETLKIDNLLVKDIMYS